jgi:hypothetical protein
MNPNKPNDDLVNRAIRAMLNTAGTDEVPAAVVAQVRRTLAERQATGPATRVADSTGRERVSWSTLAVTLLLIVTMGWIVGFHERLTSGVAEQQLSVDGFRCVSYADGHVEIARCDTN